MLGDFAKVVVCDDLKREGASVEGGFCRPRTGVSVVLDLSVLARRVAVRELIVRAHQHRCAHVVESASAPVDVTPRSTAPRSWRICRPHFVAQRVFATSVRLTISILPCLANDDVGVFRRSSQLDKLMTFRAQVSRINDVSYRLRVFGLRHQDWSVLQAP